MELLPLEQLVLPTILDGSQGINRDLINRCHITAQNDIAAIECWLAEHKHSENTYRNYRREAERFLLWAVWQQKKALSSLNSEDMLAYSKFLDDPQPQDFWCGPKQGRKGKRWSDSWRPFEKPGKQNSKGTILSTLASLFDFLYDNCYLSINPIRPVRRQVKNIKNTTTIAVRRKEMTKRLFSITQWKVIYEALNEMPEISEDEKSEKERLRYMIAIFYFVGPRVNDIAKHTMTAFYKSYNPFTQKTYWWFEVIGKGESLEPYPCMMNY